jgi:hypothetical protein
MDEPAMIPQALGGPAPCPVADTMRRVQDQLRRGAAPSFESLLAYGEPAGS